LVWRPSRRACFAGSALLSGLALLAVPWLLPVFWTNVGSVERIRGGDAEFAYKRALQLQPKSWPVERGLGLLGSVAWLQAAVRDGAPGALVHAELAQALEASGQPEAAVVEWRAAGAAPYLVRQALATDDADAREQLLLTALEVEPRDADARTSLAELYLSQARLAEARGVLQGSANASYPRLLLGLMDYWLDGNLDLAVSQLRDAPEGAPAIAEMLRDAGGQPAAGSGASDTLGRAYQALGLYAQADAEFRRIADPIGRYDLGQLQVEEGQPRLALTQLRQAVQAIPNQEDFRLALARLYLDTGSLGQARQEYRVVLALDPGNLVARRALAA
jgi:hypothetical protein